MTRMMPRVTGWAVLAAATVTAAAGCMTDAESPAQVRHQADQVSLMISNAMGTGPLTEAGLIQIVESNGGGYVTAITRSGRAGTASERTVAHAVLGTSIVAGAGPDFGLGKPVSGTPAVLCYRVTVGYYSYQVWQAQEPCPGPRPGAAGGFAATATAQASQVQSAQNAVYSLPRAALAQVSIAPVSLPRQLTCWASTGMPAGWPASSPSRPGSTPPATAAPRSRSGCTQAAASTSASPTTPTAEGCQAPG